MEEKDIFITVTMVSFLALDLLIYNFFSVVAGFSNNILSHFQTEFNKEVLLS